MDSSELHYFQNKIVLITDDHKETREALESILKVFFKEVICAENGLECLEKVEYFKPDILITDIQMPELDGLKTIEKIRDSNHRLTIIILSAYNDVEYLLKASNLDIQGYLLKPINMDDLSNTLLKLYKYENKWIDIVDKLKYSYINSSLLFNDQSIPLGHKENEFLHILVQNNGNTVSYEVLEELIWGKDNENMSFDSIRTLVKKLRKKIPVEIIENVSKHGYKISNLQPSS